MTTEGLKTIISKALTDTDFRQQLLENLDDVLTKHEISDEEAQMLRNLKPDAFDEMDMDVEERQSKSGLAMGLGSLMSGRDAATGDVGALIDILMNKYG